jgi:putative hydrolase of HD superfamily
MDATYENEKLGLPSFAVNDPSLKSYAQIMGLKRRFRRGWLRAGISREHCESVADHSFGVMFLCLLFASRWPETVDAEHAALIALVHELGEIHAGDITPTDGIGKPEKHRRELDSLQRVIADMGAESAELVENLWAEYEAGTSSTARFVKAMDKLEMASQAAAYRSDGLGSMGEFIESAATGLSGTPFESMVAFLRSEAQE